MQFVYICITTFDIMPAWCLVQYYAEGIYFIMGFVHPLSCTA